MRLLLFLWIGLLVSGSGEPGHWLSDYDLALTESRSSEKPILIYFSGSDWCKPCILLSREALDQQEFMDYAGENLVLVKADFPRKKKNQLPKQMQLHNDQLAEKFNPTGEFPLLVMIDSNETVLYRSGYTQGGAEYYIDAINTALEKLQK